MPEPDQERRLESLLAAVTAGSRFYRQKYRELLAAHPPGWTPGAADFEELPFTTKEELVADQARHPPFGSGLTLPVERFTRLHRTSGTTGRPLTWLDTPES